MKFSSNKVVTVPVIADTSTLFLPPEPIETEIDLGADCGGGPFTEYGIGVIIFDGANIFFYTYDEYIEAVKNDEIDPMQDKQIGTYISCQSHWAVLAMSTAEFLNEVGICCSTPSIADAAMVFKLSAPPLTPGQEYPCGTAAEFKWLVVKNNVDGSEAPPNPDYYFEAVIVSQDQNTTLNGVIETGEFSETKQRVLNWPDDFIGLTFDGITLVAPTATPGVSEMRISDFDYGTITITSRVESTDLISQEDYSIPNTACGFVIPFMQFRGTMLGLTSGSGDPVQSVINYGDENEQVTALQSEFPDEYEYTYEFLGDQTVLNMSNGVSYQGIHPPRILQFLAPIVLPSTLQSFLMPNTGGFCENQPYFTNFSAHTQITTLILKNFGTIYPNLGFGYSFPTSLTFMNFQKDTPGGDANLTGTFLDSMIALNFPNLGPLSRDLNILGWAYDSGAHDAKVAQLEALGFSVLHD